MGLHQLHGSPGKTYLGSWDTHLALRLFFVSHFVGQKKKNICCRPMEMERTRLIRRLRSEARKCWCCPALCLQRKHPDPGATSCSLQADCTAAIALPAGVYRFRLLYLACNNRVVFRQRKNGKFIVAKVYKRIHFQWNK